MRGKEIRVDLIGAKSPFIANAVRAKSLLKEAARFAGATVVGEVAVDLGENGSPPGFTVAILLDESHLTAHYYTEGGKLALNAFTCGERAKAENAMQFILDRVNGEVVFQDETGRFPC